MTTVVGLLQKLTKDDNWIDDGIDRMTRRYTVAIIAIELLVVYGGGFLRGNYIQCFTPKYFTGAQEKYSEKLCWLESTHYILEPQNEEAVDNIGSQGFYNAPIYKTTGGKSGYVGPFHPGQKVAVSYYQWVPIFMIIMALLSHVPFLIWKHIALKSCLPLKSMVTAARSMSSVANKGEALRNGFCQDMSDIFLRYSDARKSTSKSFLGIGRKEGNLIFYSYVMIKILYIIMFGIQLLLLQAFLGNDPRMNILNHGLWVIGQILTTATWPQHPAFPIDTTCVIMAEQQGNPLPYTLQCILPMNLYFDKFFAVFTIAFPILMGLFFCSLIGWILAMSRSGRNRFLQTHLVRPQALADDDDNNNSSSEARLVEAFHKEFLLKDGIFALELIKMNVGGFVCDAVLENLWLRYSVQRGQRGAAAAAATPDNDYQLPGNLKKRASAPFKEEDVS